MDCQNMYSKGFPTNRIPVRLPSSGRYIILRETTIIELKSIAKTIIDNISRRQMDVIYDAITDYLQAMILTEGVDVRTFTEFDRLFCLIVFFQISFYKDPTSFKCPHCGVEISYRYDMAKYLSKLVKAYVEDQVVEIPFKSRTYEFKIGWPTCKMMSELYRYFYNDIGDVTDEMESTQFGINFVMLFVKSVSVKDSISGETIADVDLASIESFKDHIDCLNEIPAKVMFDDETGLFSSITGYFINRMENCFQCETCPQCNKETDFGIPQSQVFYSLMYGSIRSLYKFVLQVECLMVFRYDSFIYEQEQYLTYNDLSTLMHQLQTTVEKDNKDRQKVGHDHLYKGLWYIREILNTLIFPEDRKHSNH